MTQLEEVVTELDKKIASMRNLIAANPSSLRTGMKMAYEDIRECVQNMRIRNGELK